MSLVLSAFWGGLLVLVQTTLLPMFAGVERSYDLMVPFIVWLGLQRSFSRALPVILLCGAVMDSLSGAPFGYYASAYLWILGGTRWLIRFLRVGNSIMLPVTVLGAVMLQNLIFLALPLLLVPDARLPVPAMEAIPAQLLWATFTGPVLLAMIGLSHQAWEYRIGRQRAQHAEE